MRTLICTAAAAFTVVGAGAAQAGDVTVALQGVEARGGVLYVALQTRDQFMRHEGLGRRVAVSTAGEVTVTFEGVTPGDYALSVFHDENGDGEMQRTENGMPVEGWAMSNADALRGPPEFDQVSVTVSGPQTFIRERMRYVDGETPAS